MVLFGRQMNFQSPWQISLLFLLLFLGISSLLYFPRYIEEEAKKSELAALLSSEKDVQAIDPPIKSVGCAPRGILPDHDCTPGAIFPSATVTKICTPGYSKTVRNVPQKLRKAVFAEYSVPYPQPRGAFEVDHLVPLALGGSNDIANLWLEAAEPAPGFREKDIVEIYLWGEICAGRIALNVAQGQIARDWFAVYKNLTPEQIEQIKTRFRSWSN